MGRRTTTSALLMLFFCVLSGCAESKDKTATTAEMSEQAIQAIATIDGPVDAVMAHSPIYPVKPEKLNILFVGNSYMAYRPIIDERRARYSVYHQVTNLLDLSGVGTQSEIVSIGGGTLKEHWEAGSDAESARGQLITGDYDLLIIQGRYDIHQSEENAARFLEYADRFVLLAREHNVKTLFFGLWATDKQISAEGDKFGPVAHEIYRKAAEQNLASYAPNGMAYGSLYSRLVSVLPEDEIETAMTADSIHPTTALAYLAANVVFYSMLNVQPPPLSAYQPPGISNEIGELIRLIARESVANYAFNSGS